MERGDEERYLTDGRDHGRLEREGGRWQVSEECRGMTGRGGEMNGDSSK
jgi:hypothetical protein